MTTGPRVFPVDRSQQEVRDRPRSCRREANPSEPVPLTRQLPPLAGDALAGHRSPGSGGAPRGAGLTNRAETSPPPVIRLLLVAASPYQPCGQGLKR